MKNIILDTNFLLIPYLFKVDIFSEINRICRFRYQLYVAGKTIDELENIVKKQRGKNRGAALFALKLIKGKHLKTLGKNQGLSVDDAIVGLADKETIVATQDAELKRRLKQRNVSLIILRQKKYLKLLE